MQAVRNETGIAESADTAVVDGNHYFPGGRNQIRALRARFDDDRLSEERAPRATTPWWSKVRRNEDITWYTRRPKTPPKNIEDRVAFWRGVEPLWPS